MNGKTIHSKLGTVKSNVGKYVLYGHNKDSNMGSQGVFNDPDNSKIKVRVFEILIE
ncbi:hypothetical protein PIROE2DRAFT_2864 [Piromyces sp. E2]|nr:hypothetical protein PIROE2DRAFT_2864 [Piromyces sp. E2]|eukprot:OUM69172.1 hypothetical protein PIROE2DRAFT_2864 [Piromyces sp. E2]